MNERGDRRRESHSDPVKDNPESYDFEPLAQLRIIGGKAPKKIDHSGENEGEYRVAEGRNENLETTYYQIGWPGSIDLS